MISIVEPSPHDAASAYVAATCYKSDDTRPYLYRTDDYGQTWRASPAASRMTNSRASSARTRSRRGLLYCGTERGIHVSFDDGVNWHRQDNLPITPVWDLVVKGTDLVAATHGRSFWILDDITPLREQNAEATGGGVHLFPAPLDGASLAELERRSLPGSRQGPQELHDGTRDRAHLLRGPDARRRARAHVSRRRRESPGWRHRLLHAERGVRRSHLHDVPRRQGRRRSARSRRGRKRRPPPTARKGAAITGSASRLPPASAPDERYLTARSGLNRFVWDLRYPGRREGSGRRLDRKGDHRTARATRALPGPSRGGRPVVDTVVRGGKGPSCPGHPGGSRRAVRPLVSDSRHAFRHPRGDQPAPAYPPPGQRMVPASRRVGAVGRRTLDPRIRRTATGRARTAPMSRGPRSSPRRPRGSWRSSARSRRSWFRPRLGTRWTRSGCPRV